MYDWGKPQKSPALIRIDLEPTFFQPFAEARRSGSVLIISLGNKGLGCCDEKTSDQKGRKNHRRAALSRLRGEQQHGLATKTNSQIGRAGGKERLLQTFVAESLAQHATTTGNRNSSPCTASGQPTEAEGLERGADATDAVDAKDLRGRINE